MTSIDHMEFWSQLDARIRERRSDLMREIDAGPQWAEATLRHAIGQRVALAWVQKAAREVYAEMTGTTVQPPEREPDGDDIQL